MKITLNHAITLMMILRELFLESDTNEKKQGSEQFCFAALKTSGLGHGRQLFRRGLNTSGDSQLGGSCPKINSEN